MLRVRPGLAAVLLAAGAACLLPAAVRAAGTVAAGLGLKLTDLRPGFEQVTSRTQKGGGVNTTDECGARSLSGPAITTSTLQLFRGPGETEVALVGAVFPLADTAERYYRTYANARVGSCLGRALPSAFGPGLLAKGFLPLSGFGSQAVFFNLAGSGHIGDVGIVYRGRSVVIVSFVARSLSYSDESGVLRAAVSRMR